MADQSKEVKRKKYPVHEGYVDINKFNVIDVKEVLKSIWEKHWGPPTDEEMVEMEKYYDKER